MILLCYNLLHSDPVFNLLLSFHLNGIYLSFSLKCHQFSPLLKFLHSVPTKSFCYTIVNKNIQLHKIFLHSFPVLFSKLLNIVYWKIEISKNNSTVLKKPQAVMNFSTKKYNLHNLFYLCFKNILPVQFLHPFLHSNSPEHTIFSFFSTHKLYTTLNNLHKITFTPYIVNQIDRTQKGINININLLK